MARPCSTCIHPRRGVIDRALVSSAPVGATARRFGISVGALRRHQQNHLAEECRIALQSAAGSDRQPAVRDRSEFVEMAVVASMSSAPDLEVELRTDEAGTSLRLRGRLEPEALRVLALAVVGSTRSPS